MTSKELSINFDKAGSWLSGIKCNHPKQYKWLMSFDINKLNSLNKARELSETTRNELADKISYLNSLRLQHHFMNWIQANKNIDKWFTKSLYVELKSNLYFRYNKYKLILEYYDEWIKQEHIQWEIKKRGINEAK